MMQDVKLMDWKPAGAHMVGTGGGGGVGSEHPLCVAAAQLAEREGAVLAHGHLAPRLRVQAGCDLVRGRRWGGGSGGGVGGGCIVAGTAAAAAAASLGQLDGVLLLNALVCRRSGSFGTRIMIWHGRRALPPSVWTSGVGEDKSFEDLSAQNTRIHSGCGLRLKARNILNSEEEE